MTDDTTLINPSIPKYNAPVLEEDPLSNNVTQVATSARFSGKAKNYSIQKIIGIFKSRKAKEQLR